MTEPRTCPQCGADLAADAPDQPCPACLMKLGLESWAARSGTPFDPRLAATDTPSGRFVPPEPEQLAERFPQFEILELLGHGGMGAVYKARQRHLGRVVALKILPPEIGRDPAFTGRFQREAQALASLNHPHIVTVHDFGEADGLYYLVMEYVDGTNLRQLLPPRSGAPGAERPLLTPAQALAIVPQICDALQYAHEEGVIHRDIKPENILIDRRGRVKIADFGLAKLLGRTPAGATLTGTAQVMGTMHYMAPEQMQGSRGVDHRADIYSLGVVFYEMLTGDLPVGRFDPPSQRAQVDVRLDEVVLRALEREPERRYQRVSEIRTQIESIASTPAGSWREEPPSVAVAARQADRESALRQVRWPANGLLAAGILVLALPLLMGLVGAVMWFLIEKMPPPPAPPPWQHGGRPVPVSVEEVMPWDERWEPDSGSQRIPDSSDIERIDLQPVPPVRPAPENP